MTKKHFKAIAEIISKQVSDWTVAEETEFGEGYNTATEHLAQGLADYLATQSPLFNREKFLKACGL
ncbi:MAG: hypothetical protein Q8L68_03285 [Methylococcales bacterium]|nr:hypothetical protein [Methylococcales bacterium]